MRYFNGRTMYKLFLTCCLLLFAPAGMYAQPGGANEYRDVVARLDARYHACLDAGVNMAACAREFYFGMDSMLNVVYRALRSTLDTNDKTALKKEQIGWLKKRDAYFSGQERIFRENMETGEWGPDMIMITYGNEADFVKERVLMLIERIP